MANSSEGAKRAAHLRYHVKPGILKADCALCRLVAEASGNPLPTVPNPPRSVEKTKQRLEITGKLAQFDAAAVTNMAARQRTLSEAAIIFSMTAEQFEEEIRDAFGITWEQLSSRASIALFDEIEQAIWREARGGDIRFISLLISLNKLPGWNEVPTPQTPMRQLPPGIHEIVPQEDLRTLSLEELKKKRFLLEKKALENVIDAPSTAKRLEANQSPTLEITDATELPSGWIRAQDGTPIVEGCEDSYEIAQKEQRG
jgi:hypothetical protein